MHQQASSSVGEAAKRCPVNRHPRAAAATATIIAAATAATTIGTAIATTIAATNATTHDRFRYPSNPLYIFKIQKKMGTKMRRSLRLQAGLSLSFSASTREQMRW